VYNEKVDVEDYELWLRAIKKGIKITNLNIPLLKYRIDSKSGFKRGRHWRSNILIKLKYFDSSHIFYRLIGLLIIISAYLLPTPIGLYLYKKFNYWR